MLKTIIKRSGEKVPFDASKIRGAIFKANVRNATEKMSDKQLDQLTQAVVAELEKKKEVPTVEQIQDVVEEKLIAADYAKTAKAYILYRAEHQKLREMDDELVKIYSALTFVPAEDADLKRENANINADTAMGTMLKYGSEGAKSFYDKYVIPPHIAKAHAEGQIHIHDKDFYTLTETCCQIDLIKLFHNGFSTEMCIRDSPRPGLRPGAGPHHDGPGGPAGGVPPTVEVRDVYRHHGRGSPEKGLPAAG